MQKLSKDSSLSTSKKLNSIKDNISKENISLSELTNIFSTKGVQFLIILLIAPFLIPISIPGSSTPFGLLIILLEIAFLLNKSVYIPNFIGKYEISKANVLKLINILEKMFKYLEKIIKPRGNLYSKKYAKTLNAVMTIIMASLLFLPLPIPFTDFIPAISMLILSLSILEKDSYLMILGFVSSILTIMYFISVGYIGVKIIILTLNHFGIYI